MKKIIIGFDSSRAFLKKRTGTENYSYKLLKALAKIDRVNDYIIYTTDLHNLSTAVEQMYFPKNFRIVKIGWSRLWTQGGLGLQTFKDKLDVLFIPAHTLPIIRKPGLKTVVTVHDLGSEYLPSMHQLKQRAYLSFMQKTQLKGTTKIIAVSRATKEDLVKKIGLKPGKIKVVYEGYDKKLFKPGSNDILVDSLIPYFLFVGTIQPRKNLERVIKAFSISHPWGVTTNLVIVGSKGWMSDKIYALPKKLGIEDRVKFLGYVPEEKLPALYSNAQALVFPSLFEGFGLPILDAQACGCPVITSNLSSMPEVGGKGALYVDPYSVDDIVKGMVESQKSKVKSKKIKAGFENIKRFSWEKCARETLKVLLSS